LHPRKTNGEELKETRLKNIQRQIKDRKIKKISTQEKWINPDVVFYFS
jgi:hypothetical protein